MVELCILPKYDTISVKRAGNLKNNVRTKDNNLSPCKMDDNDRLASPENADSHLLNIVLPFMLITIARSQEYQFQKIKIIEIKTNMLILTFGSFIFSNHDDGWLHIK